MPEEENISKLENAMLQPKKVEIDNQTVEQHSLEDMIAMDRYLASKKAVSRNRTGLRIAKMKSGGAVY